MRKPAPRTKPRIAQAATFAASTSGWIANANLAAANEKLQGAFMLQNFFPLTTSILLRRGSVKYATIGGYSFSRASTATYINDAGIIATAQINEIREQNGTFLLEGAATNLALQSQAFDNATWSKLRTSVTVNATTAPDSTSTADKLVEDSTSNTHGAVQTFTPTANATYTHSIFVKAAERTKAIVRFGVANVVANNIVLIDLIAGTFTATDIARTKVQSLANGWYRVSTTVTIIASPAGTSTVEVYAANNTATISNFSYLGDGVSGVYVWGDDLEAASSASSYIPTVAVPVMRAADIYTAITPDPVLSLMSYKNGNQNALFGATGSAIYDITVVANPDIIPAPAVTGLTSGQWASEQFATTGGTYLVNVNASDDMRIFDGMAWWAINNQPINRLNFDAQTANFPNGATITGGTSGSTAIIQSQTDAGTTGSLIVGAVTGSGFVDNELITGGGGSATVNGVIQPLFVAFTGIATNQLSYVWSYKSRLFFIEKNSMNVWYLPIDQIGGAAVKFPMGGIFTLGGSLLFGASWSLDTSGDGGLSEQCVFVTTEGEVAVYQGNNPADANNWSKVGTYRIGKPLGPKAFIRAGGDLVIATSIGFVPLSQAIQRDIAALSPAAVSYKIETEWNNFVSLRAGANWNCEVWPSAQMVVLALPTVNFQPATMLVSNARTGAWAQYTNWDGNCLEVFNDRLFFGSQNGRVVEANVSGADEGQAYTGLFVPLFDDMKTPGSRKIALNGRVFMRGPREPDPAVNMQFDYIYTQNQPNSAPVIAGGSQWGVGIWGQSIWGVPPQLNSYEQWVSIGGSGYAMAPDVQITSGSVIPLDTEIIRFEMTYDLGDILS